MFVLMFLLRQLSGEPVQDGEKIFARNMKDSVRHHPYGVSGRKQFSSTTCFGIWEAAVTRVAGGSVQHIHTKNKKNSLEFLL